MLPDLIIEQKTETEFDEITGFELKFGENEKSFLAGFDRFNNSQAMYGYLEITGKPVSGM